jgi:hypothetical protein
MTEQARPLICDACGAQSSAGVVQVDQLHDRCPAPVEGRWRRILCDACDAEATGHVTPGASHPECAFKPPGRWFPVVDEGPDDSPSPWETFGADLEAANEAADLEALEASKVAGTLRLLHQRAERVGGGVTVATCEVCGCTDELPCPGGCIWANAAATLCSRCALGGAA